MSEIVGLAFGSVVLLVLSGTFSGSETAFFSLDRLKLRQFEDSGSGRGRLVAGVVSHPERLLAGVLFGNTLVNVASSSVMLAIVRRYEDTLLGRDPVLVSVVVTTAILLLFGEILPKGMAVHWPARVSAFLAPILIPLLWILAPASRVLERIALAFLHGAGVRKEEPSRDQEWRELRLLFEDMQAGKGISEDEGLIAANVFSFFETRAYEIMTPRVDMIALALDSPPEELTRQVIESQHSRIPVYRGSLDQIIGFLNTKEFLLDPGTRMETLLHPVHFVPERARLHRVLTDMQTRRVNLVVVVNEFGGTSGILTQEDLVEEVVGEIFDEQEQDQAPELEKITPQTWRVAGLLSLDDLGESLEVEVPESPAETVAGHVAHILGRLPRVGDEVQDGPLTYKVTQVKRHRAQRVLVTKNPEPPPATERESR